MRPPDPHADLFRFRLGQAVQWTEGPHARYVVTQRRWTEREMVGPVVEYRLRLVNVRSEVSLWIYESDLASWEEQL